MSFICIFHFSKIKFSIFKEFFFSVGGLQPLGPPAEAPSNPTPFTPLENFLETPLISYRI